MTASLAQSHLSGIVISNLMRVWSRASIDERRDGRDWYFKARRTVGQIAGKHGIETAIVAGIVSALSPGLEWSRNIDEAKRFILEAGTGQYGVYGTRNTDKARRILAGESPLDVLGGPKVRAFYHCIMNPCQDTHVVIDSHAWCAGMARTNDRWARNESDNPIRVTEARHHWMGRHYAHCASTLGLYACEFQAVIWLTWKRLCTSTTLDS